MPRRALALALAFSGCILIDSEHLPPTAIRVPNQPAVTILPRRRVATDLANPRGMLVHQGALLVALAGDGRGNSGALVRLRDGDGDGLYAGDESEVIADHLPSANAVDIVRRDEVFGAAAIARHADTVLATIAFFGGPTQVLKIEDGRAVPWTEVDANLNALAFDPRHRSWLAVSSTEDSLVWLTREGAEPLVAIGKLELGQDSVPGYLRFDPRTRDVIVSLFSGSVVGEEQGDGSELATRAGKLLRVDTTDRSTLPLVEGLTAPTDLEIDECGRIYVLELCDAFINPVADLDALQNAGHGGFRRYSGRVLLVDRRHRTVRVVADQLDTPTNLTRDGRSLYVAGGMGTPGRTIPGPHGPTPLIGYIDRIDIGAHGCE